MAADAIRNDIIKSAASTLGVQVDALDALIRFETSDTYNPQIKNKNSSARGLLQFTDATAKGLGYSDSLDLVTTLNTFSSQMKGAVIPYLQRYAPFPTRQSLYMAVFYPAARNWPISAEFPATVQKANPNIKTVNDYVALVERRAKMYYVIVPLALLAAGYIAHSLIKKGTL